MINYLDYCFVFCIFFNSLFCSRNGIYSIFDLEPRRTAYIQLVLHPLFSIHMYIYICRCTTFRVVSLYSLFFPYAIPVVYVMCRAFVTFIDYCFGKWDVKRGRKKSQKIRTETSVKQMWKGNSRFMLHFSLSYFSFYFIWGCRVGMQNCNNSFFFLNELTPCVLLCIFPFFSSDFGFYGFFFLLKQ